MASFTQLSAEARERAGKGAARATRRAGRIPAVIYGAHEAPAMISLEPRELAREISRAGWRSRLYEFKIGETDCRALMRDVQFHPVSDAVLHVDFQRLAPGEQVRVAVALKFINELTSPGLKRGGVLNIVRHSVECYCDQDHVPAFFEIDLGKLDINDNVRWSDLLDTEGVRPTITDRDFVVLTVAPPTRGVEAVAADTAAAATPAAAAAAPAAAAAKAPAAKK